MQRNVNRSSDLSFGCTGCMLWFWLLDFGCGFGCEVHLEIALQLDRFTEFTFIYLAVSALHSSGESNLCYHPNEVS